MKQRFYLLLALLFLGNCRFLPQEAQDCLRDPQKCIPQVTPSPSPSPSPSPTQVTPQPTQEPSPEPTASPLPTPSPTSTPAPGTHPPTLVKWKVGSNCHNPKDGPRFLKGECEVGSTQLFEGNALTGPGLGGPCDTDHPVTYNSICGGRDWDDSRGPERSVEDMQGNRVAHETVGENPHHTLVFFEWGQKFRICTWAREDLQTVDGIRIPYAANRGKHCEEHLYTR